MKTLKTIVFITTILLVGSCKTGQEENNGLENKGQNPQTAMVDKVNVLIGTTGDHPTAYGGVSPWVSAPFGMTHFTASTRPNRIGRCAYHFNDTAIIGFQATHQPCIWMGDYGHLSIMPQYGQVRPQREMRAMAFSHDDENASPYAYSVKMKDAEGREIKAQMTATERCAILQFDYAAEAQAGLIIEASRDMLFPGYVKIIPERNEIIGYNRDRHSSKLGPPLKNFAGYFVIRFDRDISDYGLYTDSLDENGGSFTMKALEGGEKGSSQMPGIKAGQTEGRAKHIGAYVHFNDKKLQVKIGTSFISIEQARANLDKEIPGWDYAAVKGHLKTRWEEMLGRIRIYGGTEDQQVMFYTGMYHSLLLPRQMSEHGKYYSAFDDQVHEGVAYNDYSLWDTFRALHPLLIFIAPEHVAPMMTSLLNAYKEGGWLPKWPNPAYSNIMIGTHADAVLADAMVKGVEGFDYDLAFEATYKNAMVPPDGDENNKWGDRFEWTAYEARAGLTYYKELGYIPQDKTWESVSRTLEFAYDDFCVAQIAKITGHEKEYKELMERSKNYKNLYHAEKKVMHPRLSNGEWYTGFDTAKTEYGWKESQQVGLTEGSHWTYLFCVMQDVPGMIELMGGNEGFAQRLDDNFDGGHYRHNNEPGHHYTYLYNYCGKPWKAQEWIRRAMKENYQNRPDGLSGNDDCGQMSAWYIFSAMGFYPVTPGSDVYSIGTPLFEKVELKLPGGLFTIVAEGVSDENKYVQSVEIDGRQITEPFLRHADIKPGGELRFVMGNTPNKALFAE